MQTESQIVSVNHDGTELFGHLFSDADAKDPRPAVIVCHAWAGCDAFAQQQVEKMVSLGYVGFAADLYGNGRVGTNVIVQLGRLIVCSTTPGSAASP